MCIRDRLYIDPVDFKEYKTQKGLKNYMERMNHEGDIVIKQQREGISLRALNELLFSIIFSPHMSKKQFLALLNIIIENFSDYEGLGGDDIELRKMKDIVGLSVLVPLSNSQDWGFTNQGLNETFDEGKAYGIHLSRLNTMSKEWQSMFKICLLYTSDAADE